MGTTEQSSQTTKFGGLEHNNELQKVNLWYFSTAGVNRDSLGWEGTFTLQGGALIPECVAVFHQVSL